MPDTAKQLSHKEEQKVSAKEVAAATSDLREATQGLLLVRLRYTETAKKLDDMLRGIKGVEQK